MPTSASQGNYPNKPLNPPKKGFYKYCFVPKCRNTSHSTPDKIFIRVPDNEKIRKKWVTAVRSKDSSLDKRFCCEDHFDFQEDLENYTYFKEMGGRMILKKDVLPRFFACQPERKFAQRTTIRAAVAKLQHLEAVQNILKPVAPVEDSVEDSVVVEDTVPQKEPIPAASDIGTQPLASDTPIIKKVDKAVQVKPHFRSIAITCKFKEKVDNNTTTPAIIVKNSITLPAKVESQAISPSKPVRTNQLRHRLLSNVMTTSSESMTTSTDSFKPEMRSSTDSVETIPCVEVMKISVYEKTEFLMKQDPMFYLGIPNDYFHLVNLLSEKLEIPEKHVFLTLRKVSRNEPYKMLGYDFNLSTSQINKILSKTLPLIASCIQQFIFWPSRETIIMNLPRQFRARYGNVQSIIDCFKIEIEKPTEAINHALTWSEYKKCNTLKYLISSTPDGIINFMSEGYGGRVSDNVLVQDCGYLDILPEGTSVLADRGFKHLEPLLQQRKCSLVRPPSVETQSKPTKEEVLLTKRIASVRIHIERVIRRVREFHSLLPHACIDNHLIKYTDNIVKIAAGLINLQNPLIR